MSAHDESPAAATESVTERPERVAGSWLAIGAILFVLACVLGWRSAGGALPASEAPPGDGMPG